ncbi:hypothetical protein D920_00275 [Enterococcus faecalis 13-SD-W-01]|nr:hypothetical protein D920_00275 [Enterococcus faecalis 13-SD-W-01]
MDWFVLLDKEDQEFVKQFIRASGSLKKLSEVYEVSYPTVRLRLNNIINKIEIIKVNSNDSFEAKIMQMVIDDKINFEIAMEIVNKYKEDHHA